MGSKVRAQVHLWHRQGLFGSSWRGLQTEFKLFLEVPLCMGRLNCSFFFKLFFWWPTLKPWMQGSRLVGKNLQNGVGSASKRMDLIPKSKAAKQFWWTKNEQPPKSSEHQSLVLFVHLAHHFWVKPYYHGVPPHIISPPRVSWAIPRPVAKNTVETLDLRKVFHQNIHSLKLTVRTWTYAIPKGKYYSNHPF